MSIEKVLYRAQATSQGGREGNSKSSDGVLDLKLSTPKELGGGGGPGTNPEQLFAAGYSACFLGALKFVAGQQKVALPPDLTVTGEVADPSPMMAISDALRHDRYDEVILSTLPVGVSRWVHLDLPSRVRRRFGVRVTHVAANAEPLPA